MDKSSKKCDIQKIVESVEYPKELVDFFYANKENIIQDWASYPTICFIRDELKLTKNEYKKNIATKVVEYFFTLLNGENTPGDCPVMREIINQFYNYGLKVEDVFSNCIALKNVIISNMIKTDTALLKHLDSTVLVLDYNLRNVLSLYSEKLSQNERRLREKANIIDENVLFTKTDTQGNILQVTDAFVQLTGYSKEELIGKTHSMLRDPDVSKDIYKNLWRTITSGKVWSGSFSNIKKDGSKYISSIKIKPVFENEKIIAYVAFRYDITAAELAKLDSLTNLYNRSSFEESFALNAKNSISKDKPLSILIADLDKFKNINDTYGHLKGDEILIDFAKILEENTRSSDVCSRWGGEEFAILLPDSDLETAYTIAERIRKSAQNSLKIGDESVTCSIGVAQLKSDESYEELFKRVDKYLYEAKYSGRNKTVSQ
jgi:diguanylate cyclase (GGDEF)-like protein/PAS domain S-box-containing protein